MRDRIDIGLTAEEIKDLADTVEFWADALNLVDPLADELDALHDTVGFLRDQQKHQEDDAHE